MAAFIWIIILTCTITLPAFPAGSQRESGNGDEIRIEGKRFSHDSLTFQKSERWPGRRVHITLLDRNTYEGRLLYATDDYLYAGPDVELVSNALPADSFPWSFRYDQIGRVKVLGGANFGKGFVYTMAPMFLVALGIGIHNENILIGLLAASATIPVGLFGGIIGAGEGAKKTCYVDGLHEPFRNKVPYWRKCARYVRRTPGRDP